MSNARNTRNVKAAQDAAQSVAAEPVKKAPEFPLFRSTRGEPVMLASTAGGHAVSITHEPEGTPLHPRFHRQAVMQGCLPAASFTEVLADDVAVVASAGSDRRAMIRNEIVKMTEIGSDDPVRAHEFFEADGRPNVLVLADRLGFPVSIAERDAAWNEFAGDDVDPSDGD